MNSEEQLMDALLKEQARKRDADEALLSEIETSLDGAAKSRSSAWRKAMPLSIAALLALSAAGIYWKNSDVSMDLALNEAQVPAPIATRMMEPGDQEAYPNPEVRLEAPAAPSAMMLREEEESAAATVAKDPMASGKKADALPVDGLSLKPTSKEMPGKRSDNTPRPESSVSRPKPRIVVPAMDEARDKVHERTVVPKQAPKKKESVDTDFRGRVVGRSRGGPMPNTLGGEGGREIDGVIPQGGFARSNYGPLVDQPWKSPWQDPLSTFSIDVDTASYTNLRRMIHEGRPIPPDAVRIEECVNYFDYQYEAPQGDSPFAVSSLLATCPWKEDHLVARVAIKGREIGKNARPASNLVFLIDVSGSMQSPDKLPMLKRSMRVLLDELDERDRLGIVVYASREGVVLPPTQLNEMGKSKAIAALAKLEAGGSTNGGAGVKRAYQMALDHKVDGGVNRVILATDGDFNVGVTGQGELVSLVEKQAAKGVSLSVLGFGTGNLNDAMMEAVTNDGNGNYFYIDGDAEAKRVFLQKLTGTLVTIAKDVKIQVEFNPGKVKAYRLIGYANRILRKQDFNDDKVDAGDIGAGHTVTAFYEIVPAGVEMPETGEVDGLRYQRPAERKELVESDDWLILKLRYKHPEGEKSRLIETPVKGAALAWKEAGNDFRMASAVAMFGMKLRGMPEFESLSWGKVKEVALPALADDLQEERAGFVELLGELERD